jgi:hypothetical protein
MHNKKRNVKKNVFVHNSTGLSGLGVVPISEVEIKSVVASNGLTASPTVMKICQFI